MDIEQYIQLFIKKEKPTDGVSGLCGRIIRGTKPEDFFSLSDDKLRKVVMYFDSEGLESMIGLSGYDMLINVGYEPEYLEHKIDSQTTFKLFVFREPQYMKLADWNNVLDMLLYVYPKTRYLIERYRYDLNFMSFEDIECESSFSFFDIEKKGLKDSRFMTYERLHLNYASLYQFRAFLYFSIHLRELFNGDGLIKTIYGEKKLKEYIILNQPIIDFADYRMIELDVNLWKKGELKNLYTYVYRFFKFNVLFLITSYLKLL